MSYGRENVKLTLHTTTNTFLPGDVIQGTLRVEVLSALDITAIRVLVTGKETSWKRISRGMQDINVNGDLVHYDQTITVFGAPKSSSSTSGVSVQRGVYDYNFQAVLPPNATPSFGVRAGKGGSSVEYNIKAVAYFPSNYDAFANYPIRVLPCVPVSQLTASQARPLQLQGVAQTHGFFGGTRKGEFIDTKLTVLNPVAVLSKATHVAAPHGAPPSDGAPPSSMRVRLTVHNQTKADKVKSVQVALRQAILIDTHGYKTSADHVIATAQYYPKDGELQPAARGGSATTFDVDIVLPDDTSMDNSKQYPMATLRTPFVDCSCYIEVQFAGVKAETVALGSGAVHLVAAVDHSNRAPSYPIAYEKPCVLPEINMAK